MIPIVGSRQSDTSGLGDARRYLDIREKMIQGSFAGGNMGGQGGGNFGMDFANSMWYSPELMPDIWAMPKSRMEILKWVRFFYNTDPYIYAITNMHAQYPFSMFDIVSSDERVTEFYKKASFNKDFNLYDLIMDMSLSYQKFGEAIVMGQSYEDSYDGVDVFKWKNFVLFEPETINIYKNVLERKPHYSLVITPDFKEDIRKMQDKGKEIHPLLLDSMNSNQAEIDLEGMYMSRVMNTTDPSAIRGTSPIQCLLRTLMFQDKVNLLKITAIDRYRYPLEIWKIGDVSQNIIPDTKTLEDFERMIKQAKENPPYALFVPPFVQFEVAGFAGEKSIFDYKDDYEWTQTNIMVGMGVNKNLIMGEGPSFSNMNQLSMQKLIMGYNVIRDKFTNWMINQYFYTMAEKNDFITETGDLNIPQVVWHKDLERDSDDKENYTKLWEKGLISTKTLFGRYKDLDLQQEQELLKDEIGSIFDDQKRIRNREPKPIGEEVATQAKPAGGGAPEAGGEEMPPEEEEGGAPAGSPPGKPPEEAGGGEAPEAGGEGGGVLPTAEDVGSIEPPK